MFSKTGRPPAGERLLYLFIEGSSVQEVSECKKEIQYALVPRRPHARYRPTLRGIPLKRSAKPDSPLMMISLAHRHNSCSDQSRG